MKDSQGPRPSSRGTFLGPGDAERVRFPTQRYVRLGWCLRKAFGPKKYHTHLLRPLLQTAVRAPACFISTTATILLLQTHRYPTYLLSNFTHTSHLWPYASCRHTSDIGPHWGSPRLSTSWHIKQINHVIRRVFYNKKLLNFQLARWLSCWSMRPDCKKSHGQMQQVGRSNLILTTK